jgi:DNA-binding CsgD family transcriptional regulator
LAIRQTLHHEAARKLRDAGYPPAKVAAQLLRGATGADRDAIELLRWTARRCAHREPALAVALLERTASLIPADDASAVDVKAELARALIWAGRWTEGEFLARELTEVERQPDASREVLVTLVHAAGLHGVLPEPVLNDIDSAAHAADLESPERARLLAAASQAAFLHGNLIRSRMLASEALDASRLVGDQVRRAEMLTLLSSLGWHEGRPAEALDAAEQAVALTRQLPEDLGGTVQMAMLHVAMNLALLQRFEDATSAFQQGAAQAEQANNVWALAFVHQMTGGGLFLAGALDAAEGEFEAALSLWEEVEAHYWAITPQAWLGRIALHRGDLSGARRQLGNASRQLPPGSAWTPAKNVPLLSLTRGLVSEAEGDIKGAFAALEDARRSIVESGAAYFRLRIGPEHVRFAVAVGERAAAEEMTAATEAVAARVGTDMARGQALRCRGLLTGDAAVLLEATEAHRNGPSRIEFAHAAEEAAAALASDGAVKDATRVLHEVLDVWEGAGALHDAGRVLARLRDLGGSPGKRGTRRRAEKGWDSLTDSERRVLDLVGEGLTYREVGERLFVSRRTVETHIARVFMKLDVKSRAELAALLLEKAPAGANQ